MNRFEILEFVRCNTTSFMATADGGESRVRAMGTLTLFRISGGEVRTWSPENPAEMNPVVFDF